MDILDKIVYWLGIKGKQQQELTSCLGLGKSTFSSWKSGKSHSYRKYLPQIANFLEMKVDELIGDYGDALPFNKVIEFLCNQNGETIEQLCNNTGIEKELILETTDSTAEKLPNEAIKQLAEYFYVSEDFFLYERYFNPCPLCGSFCAIDQPSSVKLHETLHKSWEAAVEKFGFCWNSSYRNAVKIHSFDVIDCKTSTIQEVRYACIMMIKSYFSRSLDGSRFSLYHITFDEYCAAMLGQEEFSKKIPKTVFNSLVNQYGKSNIIQSGTYYYIPNKLESNSNIIQESTSLSADEKRLLDYYRNFNEKGKKEAEKRLKEMSKLDEYKKCSDFELEQKQA